jgi:UDP-glucose 4-epimerase
MLADVLGRTVPLVIGRISNLYGPGQKLDKQQGLISQLCLATARREVLNIFVPMDTLRDYLYVEDAAAMIHSLLRTAVQLQPDEPTLRNLASRRPTSVGEILRMVRQVARRPLRIALGAAANAHHEVADLRIESRFRDELALVPVTPLPFGVRLIYEHTLATVRKGDFQSV